MILIVGYVGNMDSSFLDVPRETASRSGEWNASDYHWDPYQFKATRIIRRSSKPKRRGRSRMRGPVLCQVDGCQSDLSGQKEYHQRYKICPQHMKAKCIPKDGAPHRFCQQCGRFHLLSEFDGNKRSCRVRLTKHNQRRRKKSGGTLTGFDSARSSTLSNSNSPTETNVAVELEPSTENEADPTAIASSFFVSHEQPSLFYPSKITPILNICLMLSARVVHCT